MLKLTFFFCTQWMQLWTALCFLTRRQLAVMRYADRKANAKLSCLPAAVQNVFMHQRKQFERLWTLPVLQGWVWKTTIILNTDSLYLHHCRLCRSKSAPTQLNVSNCCSRSVFHNSAAPCSDLNIVTWQDNEAQLPLLFSSRKSPKFSRSKA